MMKKLVFSLMIAALLFVPTTTSAHQLRSDGSIGAVLHVDPNDDPIVGAASNFFFELKDKNNQFSLLNCNCQVKILRNGQEMLKEALSADGTASYSFPAKGVYTIVLEGAPLAEPRFTAFTLQYDVRVSKETSGNGSATTSDFSWSPLHIVHLLLILAVAGYTVYRIESARRK